MNKNFSDEDIQKFMDKIKDMEKGERLDLSSDEDLSIAIMNLISIEEHLFFTYNKTKDDKYLDTLYEIREMRKDLLKMIIKDYEGEVWCISKHLLAASMRIMEVGTKALTKGEKEKAQTLFENSYNLYSLFWGLNLGFIDPEGISKNSYEKDENLEGDRSTDTGEENSDEMVFLDENGTPPKVEGTTSFFSKLTEIVKQAVDCCKE